MKRNILITTGGSGGHVIPATILHDHLSKDANVTISTDKRGSRYLDKVNYKYDIVDTPRLDNIFFLPFKLISILLLTFKSFSLLKNKKIEKLISTGGYMSLPLIIAAKLLNLKIYLLEPNMVLGRANKFFLNSCLKIFCYSEQIKNFPNNFKNKMEIIKPLVRENIYKLNLSSSDKDKFNLLIVGGSQGASIFGKNLKNSIVKISKEFSIRVIQQSDEKNISDLKDFYFKNNIENNGGLNSNFIFVNYFFVDGIMKSAVLTVAVVTKTAIDIPHIISKIAIVGVKKLNTASKVNAYPP